MSDHHFYTDSGFWQGVGGVGQWIVAGIALILSQCPPVRLWFKHPKLDVECFDRIALDEEMGLPNAQWHLSITNTGGREVRVKKVGLVFSRDGDRREMDARGYFENPSDTQANLLVPFRLKPRDAWTHNVTFVKFAAREARQQFREHANALKNDILAKRAVLPKDHPWVEAEPELVQPLLATFNNNFFWGAGEYQLELRVETDSPKADMQRTFRFTLFESDSDQLRAHGEQLKFGNGVYYRLTPVEPHFADIQRVV
jgi:hypothetical protein